METMNELEELRELLETKQYTKLRQFLAELNEADIAALMEELEEKDILKVYRILPKDLAADVFSYLDVEVQQLIINSLSDIVYTNTSGLFMGYKNNVRMVHTCSLSAGMTLFAGRSASFFTLQRRCKDLCNKFLTAAVLTMHNVST